MSGIIQDEQSIVSIMVKKVKDPSLQSFIGILARNLICRDAKLEEVCEDMLKIFQFGFHTQIICSRPQSAFPVDLSLKME